MNDYDCCCRCQYRSILAPEIKGRMVIRQNGVSTIFYDVTRRNYELFEDRVRKNDSVNCVYFHGKNVCGKNFGATFRKDSIDTIVFCEN